MSNEEFQKLVLEQLSKINARLDNIEGQVKENTDFIGVLLHRTEEMDAQLHALSSTVDKLCGQVNNLENKVNNLENKVNNLEVQFNALHAQVTDIQANMATKEDIAMLDAKFNVLNNRLTNQEVEIYRLKMAR
ncbi:conserved hypothetical protein [Thermosinus carboxydivorans Nor1]|uniref:Uncharacterized protein n=1 Tax=Thermosinus carboxydivorans Nor1 TaxID=401526 RepID=A1HUF4_9FIRM|nr:hypothetical protein [Thermosinus carboxydivorans]EAX46343.1 conserved hypothetical protein [Thermosinus carboxydivorans Nor1]